MNYHFPQVDFLSRRALAFCGIAAFHILIAYLLLTALVQPPPLKLEPPMTFVTPRVVREPPAVVQDFHPSNQTERIRVPDPEVLSPPQDPSRAPVAVLQPADVGGAAVSASPTVRVIGVNQLPNSEDYYPPDMRRLEVQGATNLRVCVDAQGARLGDPTIEESSGYPRLDIGAVNLAKHGRYAKSMQGTTPVGNCFRFRITFKIPK